MTKMIIYGELFSSKNSRQVFRVKTKYGKMRTIVAKSDNAKKQEVDFAWQLKDAKRKHSWLLMTGNLAFPYRVHFKIYRRTKRAFDYDNITFGLRDAMQREKYIPKDDMNHMIPVYEPYAIDKTNPRCEVWVENIIVPTHDFVTLTHNPETL